MSLPQTYTVTKLKLLQEGVVLDHGFLLQISDKLDFSREISPICCFISLINYKLKTISYP